MRILQVSTRDTGGGAEKAAGDLFRAYQRRGHDSFLAVGSRASLDPSILEVPNDAHRAAWARVGRTLQRSLQRRGRTHLARLASWWANLGEIERWQDWRRGVEDFHFPGTGHLLTLTAQCPDIVHAHNLHGGYFDLRALIEISRRVPTVVTLHDEWLLTGHCAYTLGCRRWEIGCGQCPDLTVYPSVRRDATAFNWRRKGDIYRRSRLFVASPSRWLMDEALRSVLQPAMAEHRVIPYGIDLSIFRPGDRRAARLDLGLPPGERIVLFVGNRTVTNRFKDYGTMEGAVRQSGAQVQAGGRIFLCLGEEKPTESIGSTQIRFVGYQGDPRQVARYYQASDVYIHAARADNSPYAVLEALACGIPVVATAVGGIPEQIEDGGSGFLVPAGNSSAMAACVQRLLDDADLHARMSQAAAARARRLFDLERAVDDYLQWYREIVQRPETQSS